jgi:enoyl-CoA hydratase
MGSDAVLVHRDGGVATVRLNRPDVRNAMTVELTAAFERAIGDLREDQSLRAVVVTGEGTAFCAGGDLTWVKPGPDASVPEMRRKMRTFYPKFLAVRSLDAPTIAAINGPAVGAGLCLAMACDIRIASEEATFATAFTRLGMHPGMAATYLLTRLVGTARAAELFFTAGTIDAAEAARIGLVNKVVPSAALMREAGEMAAAIAANAPIAVGLVKRAVYLAERADLETMLEYEGLAQPVTLGTRDLQEGLDAVREKRPPSFTGE